MSKAGSAAKVKLSSYDDLFGNAEEKTGSEEQIIRAKLTDLHEFRNHPFRVLDDEKMEETTESISKKTRFRTGRKRGYACDSPQLYRR